MPSDRPRRFQAGQSVQFSRTSNVAFHAPGAYTIISVSPWEQAVGWTYTVKSSFNGEVRRAHEAELMPIGV